MQMLVGNHGLGPLQRALIRRLNDETHHEIYHLDFPQLSVLLPFPRSGIRFRLLIPEPATGV